MKEKRELNKNQEKENFILEVSESPSGMPCVQLNNPDPRVREIIHRAIAENRNGKPAYELGFKAGAFLQNNEDSYVLVEFWLKNYQPFVDYLNELIAKKDDPDSEY